MWTMSPVEAHDGRATALCNDGRRHARACRDVTAT